MMRRLVTAGLAAVLLGGLLAVPAAPAGAQDGSDLLDLPRLGFEIDSRQGFPGDVVGAQVDVDGMVEHCFTPTDLYAGPGVGELIRLYEAMDSYWNAVNQGTRPSPNGIEGAELTDALAPIMLLAFGAPSDPETLDELWQNLFVLTFVEPATTEMVGPMGAFSPLSGEGGIVVPELPAGLYALAAACVGIISDDELLAEGGVFDQIVPVLHDWIVEDYPGGVPPLSLPPSDELVAFIVNAAEIWLPLAVEPLALGLDFYCILQDDGFCATPPGPVGLIDDDVIDQFNGEDPGLDPGLGDPGDGASDETLLVDVVDASPSFTG